MVPTLPPEVRAAQRRIIAIVRVSGVLNRDGLALWREIGCGEYKATAADIGDDLGLLEVPYKIRTAFSFPLANSYDKRLRRGQEVQIASKDLPHLVRWMPSLTKYIEQIPDNSPGSDFMIFQPGAGSMELVWWPLAADWPSWTTERARRAKLMCAKCDYDLRRHDDERLPYNIPLPEKPNTIRLVCGQCCSDGEDEMDRRAALPGQPS